MGGRLVLVCLLVLGVGITPPIAGLDSRAPVVSPTQAQVNTTTPTVPAPGTRLAGALAVEDTTLETEYRQQVLTTELDHARTPDGRTTVVAATVVELRSRLGTLESDLRQLRTAHQSGAISDARYDAELAAITTDAAGIEGTLTRIRPIAAQAPNSSSSAASAVIGIDRLSQRASVLSEGEIRRQSEQRAGVPSPADGNGPDETTGNTTEATADSDDDDDGDGTDGDDDERDTDDDNDSDNGDGDDDDDDDDRNSIRSTLR